MMRQAKKSQKPAQSNRNGKTNKQFQNRNIHTLRFVKQNSVKSTEKIFSISFCKKKKKFVQKHINSTIPTILRHSVVLLLCAFFFF